MRGLDLSDRLAGGPAEGEIEPGALGGLLQRLDGRDRADAAQSGRRSFPEIAVLALESLEQGRLGGRLSGRSQRQSRCGGELALLLRHHFFENADRRGPVLTEHLQAGAGRLKKTSAERAGEDALRELERQLAAQMRDGLGAGGVVHRVLRELQEDLFVAQLDRRPHPDGGARIRAGATEHSEGLRIAAALLDQEEQVGEPHAGFGILTSIPGDSLLHVHGLGELPADVEENGQGVVEHLVGDFHPELAGANLQRITNGAHADELASHRRIEPRADGPDRSIDEEDVVELLVSDFDLVRPALEVLAAELHGKQSFRPVDRHLGPIAPASGVGDPHLEGVRSCRELRPQAPDAGALLLGHPAQRQGLPPEPRAPVTPVEAAP